MKHVEGEELDVYDTEEDAEHCLTYWCEYLEERGDNEVTESLTIKEVEIEQK